MYPYVINQPLLLHWHMDQDLRVWNQEYFDMTKNWLFRWKLWRNWWKTTGNDPPIYWRLLHVMNICIWVLCLYILPVVIFIIRLMGIMLYWWILQTVMLINDIISGNGFVVTRLFYFVGNFLLLLIAIILKRNI